MVAISAADDLTSELEELARAVDGLVFGNEPAGLIHARERDRIVGTIGSYLLPRLLNPSTPLLVVFAGPTGAGKSTLLNSLSGVEISETGPLRPTTRQPVVLAADVSGYDRIGGVECLLAEGRAPILASMTLVDTPDLDSTSVAHRVAAEIMIDNADVVVFVSSALRYADLVPWEVLRRARSRGAPVIHVLNRVTSGTRAAVADYRNRLADQGTDGEVIVVHEHHLTRSSSVPSVAVRSLRRLLMAQVQSSQADKAEVVRSVLWAILGQARDLIAAAELGSTEADLIAGMLDQAFRPDLGRIMNQAAGPIVLGFETSHLAQQGRGRPRRVRSWVRSKAPGSEAVAATKHRVLEILTTAVATDLRVSIQDGDVVLHDYGLTASHLDPATHAVTSEAAGSWWAGVEEMCASTVGDRPDLGALLVAVATLSPDPELAPALTALLPDHEPSALVANAGDALVRALTPVYASVRDRLAAMVAEDVTPTPEVDRAKTLVAEVVARSAFANA
ncbi:MAG TPA: GTPase domain-containing protein [Acidimicrobiia bacterium]|nr:GTPase domain-containing protein [Acidimicrobiia bacterium]